MTEEEAKNLVFSIIIENKIFICQDCGSNMRRTPSNGSNMVCKWKNCGKKHSILANTFFERTKGTFKTKLNILELLLNNISLKNIALLLNVNYRQVKRYVRDIRLYVKKNFNQYNILLGGEGMVVEMDESKFGRCKYNKGRPVEGVWVVGAVERSPQRKIVLIPVRHRDGRTHETIVQKYIRPGTIVYTDCWRGYQNISSGDITHRTVNHTLFFVDPQTGVHTNTIEGNWSALKKQVPVR